MKKSQVNNIKNLRTWVEVDAGALRYNLRQARKVIGKRTKLMVVVKSNAYGHGLVAAATVAVKNGADYLGVDSVDEGITLRKAKIKTPILILGYTLKSRLSECTRLNLVHVVYDRETVLELAKIQTQKRKKSKSAKIHLKIETGTSRQGILLNDLPGFITLLKKYPQIKLEGVYTHFSDTENLVSTYYRKQLDVFKKAIVLLEEAGFTDLIKHAASSAAIWLYPETHFDMVRLGLSYYGLWPSEGVKRIMGRRGIVLRPALSWKTKIAQIKHLKKGVPVGYDRTDILKKDSVVAVLPIGYWDGYDRKLSGTSEVLVKGKRCRVLGRVCMNMIMADVSGIGNIRIEEPVTLLGISGKEEITAEEMSQKIGTINYEMVTRINPLIPRVLL